MVEFNQKQFVVICVCALMFLCEEEVMSCVYTEYHFFCVQVKAKIPLVGYNVHLGIKVF